MKIYVVNTLGDVDNLKHNSTYQELKSFYPQEYNISSENIRCFSGVGTLQGEETTIESLFIHDVHGLGNVELKHLRWYVFELRYAYFDRQEFIVEDFQKEKDWVGPEELIIIQNRHTNTGTFLIPEP